MADVYDPMIDRLTVRKKKRTDQMIECWREWEDEFKYFNVEVELLKGGVGQ